MASQSKKSRGLDKTPPEKGKIFVHFYSIPTDTNYRAPQPVVVQGYFLMPVEHFTLIDYSQEEAAKKLRKDMIEAIEGMDVSERLRKAMVIQTAIDSKRQGLDFTLKNPDANAIEAIKKTYKAFNVPENLRCQLAIADKVSVIEPDFEKNYTKFTHHVFDLVSVIEDIVDFEMSPGYLDTQEIIEQYEHNARTIAEHVGMEQEQEHDLNSAIAPAPAEDPVQQARETLSLMHSQLQYPDEIIKIHFVDGSTLNVEQGEVFIITNDYTPTIELYPPQVNYVVMQQNIKYIERGRR